MVMYYDDVSVKGAVYTAVSLRKYSNIYSSQFVVVTESDRETVGMSGYFF